MSSEENDTTPVNIPVEGADDEGEDESADDTREVEVQTDDSSSGPTKTAIINALGDWCTRYLPFLVRMCRFGSRHWAWQRLCACGWGILIKGDGGWHGGVCDMDMDIELQPCFQCHPEHSPNVHQWHLTEEEELLMSSWRAYRSELLEHFGKNPYRYAVTVKLNDEYETHLMDRQQGFQPLKGTKGLFSDTHRAPNKKVDKPN